MAVATPAPPAPARLRCNVPNPRVLRAINSLVAAFLRSNPPCQIMSRIAAGGLCSTQMAQQALSTAVHDASASRGKGVREQLASLL
jgi:hypothetical protein